MSRASLIIAERNLWFTSACLALKYVLTARHGEGRMRQPPAEALWRMHYPDHASAERFSEREDPRNTSFGMVASRDR